MNLDILPVLLIIGAFEKRGLVIRDRSLFIAFGGWGEGFYERITSFVAEQKGRSVVTEIPKGGIAENFGRIQRGGPLIFAWKMKTWRGSRKSSKVMRGDNIQRGDRLDFTLFSPKSSPHPFGDK